MGYEILLSQTKGSYGPWAPTAAAHITKIRARPVSHAKSAPRSDASLPHAQPTKVPSDAPGMSPFPPPHE
jgi:hypothetical protein